MPPAALATALLCLAAAPPAPAPLPALPRAPVVDGLLQDLAPAREVPMPAGAGALALRAAFLGDTLYLGASLKGRALGPGGHLDVSLAFRDAGATAGGLVLRLTAAGLAPPPELGGAEPWAQALVRAAVREGAGGASAELAIPARALPRFPAFGPLLAEVCLEYREAEGAAPLRSCPAGAPPGGPLRLPEGWRQALAPWRQVEGVEGRPQGWVGFSRLHAPVWARGDAALTPASLAALVAGGAAVEARAAGIPVPPTLTLPGGLPLFAVLTGRAPARTQGRCEAGQELRLALYLVQGTQAHRALDWPVASCQLGQADRVELGGDGSLVLGYTGGARVHFTWTDQHFERSELGRLWP